MKAISDERKEHEALLPKMVAALAPTIPDTKGFILIVVDKKTGEASLVSNGSDRAIDTVLRCLSERSYESFEPAATEAVP